eukprot:scaffold1594_cov211-Skeletonema_marinoi.AAC.1
MNISQAIVEAIYSKTPPGRFLKKCPDTGQWNELSRREAADRAAQAMAYVIKGESLKEKRRQRRSRLPDQPTTNHSEGTCNNHSSSSSTHHGRLASRRGGAAGTRSNDVPYANELLRVPGHSNLQQQLLLQQLQQSSTTNLPISLGNPHNVNQNGLAQLMFQSLQQQQLQQQQQQLPLQYTMGQNPFGIQTHIGLTPQMLNQAQQLQQHSEQQQQLLRRLMTQQNVLPSPSLPMSMSLSAPFLTGHQCQLANNNFLQNQVQLQSSPSMLGVLSSLQHQPNSSVGISNVPQGAQQADQLQRSLMLQQNQLLASSSGAPSNNQLQCQQQQLPPLQAQAAQLQRNLQGSHSTVDLFPASRRIDSSSSREEVNEK